MALVDPWPSIRQAVIRQLRSNLVLKEALLGDWSEGVAPQGTDFPRGVLQLHYSPVELDWSGQVAIVGFDAVIFAKTQGEAASLASLVFTTLNLAGLSVTGQTSLKCQFVSGISLVDPAPDGTDTTFEAGGVYAVWAAQSKPVNRSLTVTLDSTIG